MQAWNAAEHTHAVTVQALPQLLAREPQNHAAQAIQLAHDVAVPADACCPAARLQEGGYSVDDAGPARHDSRPEGGRSAAAALGLAGTLCPAEQPTPTGLCAPTLYVCVCVCLWWVGGWVGGQDGHQQQTSRRCLLSNPPVRLCVQPTRSKSSKAEGCSGKTPQSTCWLWARSGHRSGRATCLRACLIRNCSCCTLHAAELRLEGAAARGSQHEPADAARPDGEPS